MEVVAMVGSTLMSSATAAGTGLSSLAASSTAGSLMQGGTTALSMLASIAGGKAEKRAAEFAAKDELIKGRASALQIREELADFLSQNTAAFAASGVDTASGTASAIARRAIKDANFNTQQTMLSSRIAGLMGLVRGDNAAAAGRQQALFQGLNFAGDVLSRGGGFGAGSSTVKKPGGGILGHV